MSFLVITKQKTNKKIKYNDDLKKRKGKIKNKNKICRGRNEPVDCFRRRHPRRLKEVNHHPEKEPFVLILCRFDRFERNFCAVFRVYE